MLQRRFGQILIVILGALSLILGFSSNAHAQTSSDESATSVSIQNNSSGTGVSVSSQGGSTVTVGTSSSNTPHDTTGSDASQSPLITTNISHNTADSTVDQDGSAKFSNQTLQAAGESSADKSVAAAVNNSGDNTPGSSAAHSDTSASTVTLTKADGTTYQATKLIQNTGVTSIAGSAGVPATAATSHQPAKPAMPMLPQGAMVDAQATVVAAGRDMTGGPLPLATIVSGNSIYLAIILSLALSILMLAGSFISQLRASGYARAPRGDTISPSQFASLGSGFNMSKPLSLSPLFVNHNQLVAASWRPARGE